VDIRGIGIDVVEVERMRRALARWGDPLTRRLFTAEGVFIRLFGPTAHAPRASTRSNRHPAATARP